MAVADQRIPVLVTAEEKSDIAARAKYAGLSVGEYLRRAAQAYRSSEDEAALLALIEQMLRCTERAEAAIDEAVRQVEASNARMAAQPAKAVV